MSDGRHIAVEFVSNAYQADDHNVIQCNIRDITKRKATEEQMHGMQTRLEQTNRDLMRKSEEIQYFYHTLSHELKTPLTAAREFVSILIDGLAGELNSTQLKYLQIAKKSCTELAVYINDLLDATRLDTGKLHIELKAVSLAAIIQRAIAIMEPVATGKKIRLSEKLDTDLMDVMVDESRIMQILTNLLNNALKFTFEGGEVIDAVVGEAVGQVGLVDGLADFRLGLGLLVGGAAVGEREVGQVAGQADAGGDHHVRLRAGPTEPLPEPLGQSVKVHGPPPGPGSRPSES